MYRLMGWRWRKQVSTLQNSNKETETWSIGKGHCAENLRKMEFCRVFGLRWHRKRNMLWGVLWGDSFEVYGARLVGKVPGIIDMVLYGVRINRENYLWLMPFLDLQRRSRLHPQNVKPLTNRLLLIRRTNTNPRETTWLNTTPSREPDLFQVPWAATRRYQIPQQMN